MSRLSLLAVLVAVVLAVNSELSGTFLHLTDLHLELAYKIGSPAQCMEGEIFTLPCCKTHSTAIPGNYRKAGVYGDANCDSPLVLLQDTFQWMSELNPQPDFIIWTGDDPSHADLTQDVQINLLAITTISGLFNQYLPKVRVLPALGNHDTWPVDQLAAPPHNEFLLNPVTKLWSQWLPEPEARATLQYGGYFSTILVPGVRVVSINTLYYDKNNLEVDWNLDGQDPAGQWAWFTKTLADSRASKERVWIVAHIPPGTGEAIENFTVNYQQMAYEYQDIIDYSFWGHTHKDEFSLLRQSVDSPAFAQLLIAPSVTPNGNQNPSVRMFKYHPENYTIYDYDQYSANLTQANEEGHLTWGITYTASEVLGASTFSGAEGEALMQRLQKDDAFFEKYYNVVHDTNALSNNPCTSAECKNRYLCIHNYVTLADRKLKKC